jgi:hypothetical protein
MNIAGIIMTRLSSESEWLSRNARILLLRSIQVSWAWSLSLLGLAFFHRRFDGPFGADLRLTLFGFDCCHPRFRS